ncbi:bifunctional o-acetylhomoserine/o-acetylserine sulfhydrylase [Streptomyces cellulosae]|jgi:O-acetylhomoserine (thiol)-lyase|uniref:Bifunctional o-acetylhomoserine/o-acetylserine sulfhydrylase n=2 Tax=Streptomyces TaxID=1883 RepID=A0ABU3JE90_9ACTN|nr:bifunctional o-acetylhomoserine/o-acetylserine sulfhydrylase [Streptomyces sp. McG7]MBT2907003.1 bifunctional o-acetylhomoserine/o-acetylserine sulfhydrylase [Streptomyces sp. McG8]MCX4481095.1 bifunctional o-acetylhomoserine/o-acetylserine sulfhydrylase [Streptomyces cellulosae]MDQ0489055.1 O-acetylhomoserine (thiol)-lyase [Streptomyces thermodiastaticus]MDT6972832.1 bifunctional o-acetylhomoserine/o-acetylserine sulfhydrylase [Streptomyces thermocarboxydus]MDX3413229.1 bifunctional o-acet
MSSQPIDSVTAGHTTDGESAADTTPAWSFETKQVHAGAEPDPTTGARATPIYQTTSFVFRDTQHAADLFALAEPGNIYTRIHNPTQDVFEQRIAALEGGVAAVALSSGQAAETLALLTVASAGDHIVSSTSLYGGTYNLFRHTLPKFGVEVSFVDDPDDPEAWRAAIRPNTKALFAESLGNPRGNVLDVRAVADVAHAAGVPLIVDNTVPTPYLLRPLEHGADVVVHSATKFLGGHGTAIAGVVVDGGTFDFGAHADRFPDFSEPDPSYHGLRYWPALGPGAFAVKLRVQLLRDLGPALSPHSAFLLLQGVETLSLRIERHSSNAQALAEWLEQRDEVAAVHYAGLPSSPWYEAGQKYLPRGAGAIVSFELRDGVEAGKRFVDAVSLFSHLANIGDVRSLIIHPASTTHSQLDEEQLAATGTSPGLVRLSVGIEALEDLKADLEAGFRAAKGAS